MILAIDTTGNSGSIALSDGEQLLEESPLYSPDGFSQTIFQAVRQLLDRHNVGVNDISCFVAASGPGSFTGVRVGLAAVKGLAEATGAKALAVSNLQALAACGTASLRAAISDARRGEVYCAIFDAQLQAVLPEAVMRFPEFIAVVPDGTTELICPEFAPFRSALDRPVRVIEQRTLAALIAKIASGKTGLDPAALDANYVRRSDAELFWKE